MTREEALKEFETHRSDLFGLAYRMLGSVAASNDIIQEAYIRWHNAELNEVRSPKAYLHTIVSRLCLDELKSARHKRETYIGPWLPEPLVAASNAQQRLEVSELISTAFLVMLESLSPVERAVFLLRELFDYEYAEISDIINKSEANCRKIAQRAREYVELQRPRFSPDKEKQHELLQSFKKAISRGDVDQLKELLAEEAVLYSDGGGKRTAARKPIYGDDKISRFIMGIASKNWGNINISATMVNNLPGFSVSVNNELHGIWSFHIHEGVISNIYVVLNPDKLRHLI